ncbi:hypothetical protein F2Q68_00012264 [Brassica cretica]|uniref:Peptidase S54 rhomboid domain-containing protein n=1 Tax=Brassica cretica TaxID=69181 RepID=A0A8S9KXK4_BRACR|nr:hypothetical protein F2Q68_00012264 [Brassica cretica]
MSRLHLHRLSLPLSSTRFTAPPSPSLHLRRAAPSPTPLTTKSFPLSSTSELNSSKATAFRPPTVSKSPITCSFSQSDITPQLELSKGGDQRKPQKRANGIFWIILINLGVYVADHFFQVRSIKSLYLYHNFPAWYQFVTATFCHASWNHLSSNLFFLYIFGKLVEEEEGNFGLWLSYLVTGVGANLVSWLVLPRNAVSVGASGAVFGLFAISVLVKMSWDWRKILEVLILGQFVIERVMEAAQASAGLSGTIYGGYSLQTVNHIAHLSGALVGVVLVWLLSKFPSETVDQEVQKSPKK